MLSLEPRYPLFGGWKTSFVLGYSVPLSHLLFRSPTRGFVLNTTFGTPIQGLVADSVEVRVALPEGAYNIKVCGPRLINGLMDSRPPPLIVWEILGGVVPEPEFPII